MSELCNKCQHRQLADISVIDGLSVPNATPKVQAELNRQWNELQTELLTEEQAFLGHGGIELGRRPIKHDWCAAERSDTSLRTYYFCDWLTELTCRYFDSGGDANVPPESVIAPAGGTVSGVDPATAVRDEWTLPLGAAYELQVTPSREGTFGAGSFQLDYDLSELEDEPAISGEGLKLTYLIFGGPGAGKTFYFKYLLSRLLAHPQRPGCLLLDPKGALTHWLADVLKKIPGRTDDLTVLKADAKEGSFNILGHNLAPSELGRLLSDAVLAGASVNEEWAVVINDLLESACVVISEDNEGRVTAGMLLREILHRSVLVDYPPDRMRVREYPIRVRAAYLARRKKGDENIQNACERIEDYYKTSRPEALRYVRSVIEKTLGQLMASEWAYLSGSEDADSMYSGIIENGRVVSVAVGQGSPSFQRSMSTLVKALFQQVVLADLSARSLRRNEGETVETPFFILACDEYAETITEGESGLVSDSRFFSQSREAGCMNLLALQSVATGRSRFPASMHDRWDGIMSNVSVKMFMKLNDVETAEMGSALAGSQHSFLRTHSQQTSAQGMATTVGHERLENRRVPPWFLTNRMQRGYALVHGTLDGKSEPTSLIVEVPKESEEFRSKE